MFIKSSPEAAGIRSSNVEAFLRFLVGNGLAMHSCLLLKGNKLFAEYYWKPFDQNFRHRMYSQTKSYVAIAIGLLEEEGKLCLDDPIVSYFPDKIDGELHPYMQKQTIRQMLTMTTCVFAPYWFKTEDPDRVHEYLNCKNVNRPAGSAWFYDSWGSQVLSALAERLSGMSLFDYLNEKIFRHLDAFHGAHILKTPNGDSWGDSGLVCTPRDMLAFGRFVMNYGTWNGKRLMNEQYLRDATSALVSNADSGFDTCSEHGYGYQIWRHQMNGFGFFGMGDQYTLCIPEKDLIFVCNADHQGNKPSGRQLIFAALQEFIVSKLAEPLPEDPLAYEKLEKYGASLELVACKGSRHSELVPLLQKKVFHCRENQIGMKWFSLQFDTDSVIWHYENEQGVKQLKFGLCHNSFEKFPQFGYSDDVGGCRTTNGFLYNCAASAAWKDAQRLALRVQVIDRYFGNLYVTFNFCGDECTVRMVKNAEDFFGEYQDLFVADMERS